MPGNQQAGNARLGSLQPSHGRGVLALGIGGVCYADGSPRTCCPPSEGLSCGVTARRWVWICEGFFRNSVRRRVMTFLVMGVI